MSGEAAPAISVRGLSFAYRGGNRPALQEVDLDLPPHRFGLLLGPTGAGKSTLVRCLNRSIPQFYPGDLRGRVVVAGRDAEGARVPEMARHVGVVFQDFESQIFSTTCLLEVAFAMENRCLPRDLIRRRVSELLARVGLAGFEERDPATLSGGEKQRLVIAAVLAQEAPVMVLDEPASDLDPGGREEVYRLFSSGEGTVLLVEHDLEGLPPAAGGALLARGKVARRWGDGSPGTMVALSDDLRASGVRPPPVAALTAVLNRQAGATAAPLRPESLEPSALAAALRGAGWSLRAPGVAAEPAADLAAPEILRCERLTHVYPSRRGGRRALDSVELSIRQGEMAAIIGANGSGKTTLARHLSGLLAPTQGRVLFKGEEVARMPARRRAAEIGLVFQNPDHQIFARTAREEVAFGPANIGLAPREVERRSAAALDAVGLAGSEEADPFTLTKGERQRLALASVLACEPSVILMDEPTTGLDLGQQEGVMRLLAGLNERGHTILIITHALWLVAGPVRRTLVMHGGRLVADGAPRDVLSDQRLMAEAGLRTPDLARLGLLMGAPLLTAEEWRDALEHRGGAPEV